MKRPLAALAALPLLLTACTYDYSNPAEKLDSGEVAGRVVADSGSGLAGVPGVTVRLRNGQDVFPQTTRLNGRFFLLGLMPGRHTVQFELADLVTPLNGWAATREVEVVWGSDGQPEGVIIGDVVISRPVGVGGTFTLPASASANGFSYSGTGYAVDDVTGAIGVVTSLGGTPPTFSFSFAALPIGPHRFRIVVGGTELGIVPASYTVGPIDWTIEPKDAGSTVPLPTTVASPTTGVGKLRFQVSAPPSLGSLGYTATVTLTGGLGTPEICSIYSDGTRECDLAAGVYDVSVLPGGTGFTAPASLKAVVSAGVTTQLGTVYITDDSTTSKASNACIDTSDCFSLEVCVNGTCQMAQPF